MLGLPYESNHYRWRSSVLSRETLAGDTGSEGNHDHQRFHASKRDDGSKVPKAELEVQKWTMGVPTGPSNIPIRMASAILR